MAVVKGSSCLALVNKERITVGLSLQLATFKACQAPACRFRGSPAAGFIAYWIRCRTRFWFGVIEIVAAGVLGRLAEDNIERSMHLHTKRLADSLESGYLARRRKTAISNN